MREIKTVKERTKQNKKTKQKRKDVGRTRGIPKVQRR